MAWLAILTSLPTTCFFILFSPVQSYQGTTIKPVSPQEFISSCQAFSRPSNTSILDIKCHSLSCYNSRAQHLHLSQLERLECATAETCVTAHTNMVCDMFSSGSFCDCPVGSAFNVTSCRCEKAARCGGDGVDKDEDCSEFNGKKCKDDICSCFSSPSYKELLLDPHSRFCVLPYEEPMKGDMTSTALVVICVIGAILSIVVLVIGSVVLYRNCTCDQGDYECEVTDQVDDVHIAAWDHPSLDYIPKDEDIVFTLSKVSDRMRRSNASTIHVVDEHENIAYVDDVDDPRTD